MKKIRNSFFAIAVLFCCVFAFENSSKAQVSGSIETFIIITVNGQTSYDCIGPARDCYTGEIINEE